MSIKAIAKTFDEWAGSGRAEGMEEGHSDVVKQVIEKMNVRPGQQILDLGCGNGWATRLLGQAAPGATAVGIDAAQAMIARAEELHSYTIRARYECMNFDKLDFNDGKFDRLFSMEALYYAPDLAACLSEAARVLKSGGTADLILDFFKENPRTECWANIGNEAGFQMHYLSEAEWKAALETAGFESVETNRVVDTRGPGNEADFQPSEAYPTWQDRVEHHECGSLWLNAKKS